MARWLGLVLVGGCSFQHGVMPAAGDAAGSGSGGDAEIDTPIGADPACFSHEGFAFCLPSPPSSPLSIENTLLDTGRANDTGCEDNFPSGKQAMLQSTPPTPVCVFAGATLILTGQINLTGELPIVFASAGTMSIDATLDASSGVFAGGGPGASTGACLATSSNAAGTGGGGAGGSFATPGGAGGSGNHTGGAAGTTVAGIETLRGGCTGGSGGGGVTDASGGLGGGAILIVARGSLTLTGQAEINASGSGGRGGGLAGDGGSGGGTGGVIVIDATSFQVSGTPVLYANGGGGGAGAFNSGFGNPGGVSTSPSDVGTGGQGGADGGDGATQTHGVGAGGSAITGGGGGGGGLGVIRSLSAPLPSSVATSPNPS